MFGATVLGAAGSASTAYSIANSIRFDGVDDYLSRTFGTPTLQTKWTWSGWVKRGTLSSGTPCMFSPVTANSGLYFGGGDTLNLADNGTNYAVSTPVFRDPSAHYHVVCSVDTGASGTDKLRLYVNGQQITTFGTDARSTYTVTSFNVNAVSHQLGKYCNQPSYFSGYLSDIYFIDGQALTPSSFGELDSNGVWVPKAYSGTYGNNGFHLDFSDGTSTTTLGYDAAGSNDWTLSGMTRAAGVNECWMVDTPTDNFATLNSVNKGSSVTLAVGNLNYTTSATTPGAAVAGTIAVSTGKWVWEVTAGSATYEHGLALADSNIISGTYATYNFARIVFLNGNKRIGSASSTAYGTGATAGDVYRFEADLDNGTLVVFKNNSSLGTLHSWTPTGALLVPHADYSTTPGAADSYNFGQGNVASATWDSASGGYFKNTPTSGFKALCTANLPAGSVTTSGSFTGNSATDGPFVWLNGSPTAMTINGNAVTFGTHADKTAGGFKLRTSSSSYNASGSNTYSITTNAGVFGDVNHAPQTAKGNP